MRNLNLLYYKEYYDKLGNKGFKDDVIRKNEDLLGTRFDKKLEPPVKNCQSFMLKVLYPGLLIGSGLPHGAGDIGGSDDDINMGFSFEYVTGQPFIPGSSVKGVLRSHFEHHAQAVAMILTKITKKEISAKNAENLLEKIFDNSDVFFDAVVCRADKNRKLLDYDYITPHSSQTKNPIPIRIIKVRPNVCFEFRFIVSDHTVDGITFSADNIIDLFKALLVSFGAGAKTNVGYGVFEEADDIGDEEVTDNPEEAFVQPKTKADFNAKGAPEMIKCPHCNKEIFRYYKDSTDERKKCYFCKKSLK